MNDLKITEKIVKVNKFSSQSNTFTGDGIFK